MKRLQILLCAVLLIPISASAWGLDDAWDAITDVGFSVVDGITDVGSSVVDGVVWTGEQTFNGVTYVIGKTADGIEYVCSKAWDGSVVMYRWGANGVREVGHIVNGVINWVADLANDSYNPYQNACSSNEPRGYLLDNRRPLVYSRKPPFYYYRTW